MEEYEVAFNCKYLINHIKLSIEKTTKTKKNNMQNMDKDKAALLK